MKSNRMHQHIIYTTLLLFCSVIFDVSVQAQDLKRLISNLNTQITLKIENAEIESLMDFYTEDIIFFPQYKSAICSKIHLAAFYKQWTDSIDIVSYNKNIYDLQLIDEHVIEIGTFSISSEYQTNQKRYTGGYFVVWKKIENIYKIESEAFVSSHYLTKDEIPYYFVNIPIPSPEYSFNLENDIDKSVFIYDNQVIDAVENGDTTARIRGFDHEAILIPNFSPIKKGYKEITPYIKQIYYPGSNLYTAHKYYDLRVINDDFVLTLGHFKGGWDRSNDSGSFEGNMLNLLKRNVSGEFVMYRQLSTSDR